MAEAPDLIDTAGIEVDRTLLAFDYLNGEPLAVLNQGVPEPIGPSGTAAAYRLDAFLQAGGYDEQLFAYWEDVDLAFTLRALGGTLRVRPDRARHASALGHARLRVAAQELPDGLRAGICAAEVARLEPSAGVRDPRP